MTTPTTTAHSPLAAWREHNWSASTDYLQLVCTTCGRLRVEDGTRGDLKHDPSPRGCRACNRQFSHKMPDDLDAALAQAAFEVGFHHGEVGLPEWSKASKLWFAQHFYMSAYEAGYGQGERHRIESEVEP